MDFELDRSMCFTLYETMDLIKSKGKGWIEVETQNVYCYNYNSQSLLQLIMIWK